MDNVTDEFVAGMMNPAIYPYPCDKVQLIETHISWVFLTGLRAWKVKKPIDFGFIDLRTLEQRRQSCLEELRLNRRLAPELYLDVVPITGTFANPRLGGSDPVLDYAVCMVQFDQKHLLSRLTPGLLTKQQVVHLADTCADFHQEAAIALGAEFGSPASVRAAVEDNFHVLGKADERLAAEIDELSVLAVGQAEKLCDVFAERIEAGRIRECHGDLHTGNMFLQNDRVTVFDGIDFNDDFRWIDVISDIAFLIMDLDDRGSHGLANRFLNRWLERTGDYAGLAVLRFYCGYRAAVRAKVDVLRMHQTSMSFCEQRRLANDCRRYLDLARQYSEDLQPSLTIMMGPSGSGKTTVAQRLIDSGDVIRLRSDVERKRLFGFAAEDTSTEMIRQKMYSSDANRATYSRLAELTEVVLNAGYPVVVDAAFLRRADRQRFAQLAVKHGVSFRIVRCMADERLLRHRVEARRRRGGDASEADEQVLAMQLDNYDSLAPDEEQVAVPADEIR